MKNYEFIFSDGTRMTGDGGDLAEGLLNAYHRNGYLPICDVVEKNELLPVEVHESIEPKKKKARPSPSDSNPFPDR